MGTDQHGLIRPHVSKISFLFRFFDILTIMILLHISVVSYGIAWNRLYVIAGLSSMVLFYLFSESTQLYRSWRGVPLKQSLMPLMVAWSLTCFFLLVLGYMTKTTGQFSRVAIGFWMLSVPLVLSVWRMGVRAFLGAIRRTGYNTRSVAIVGANELGAQMVRLIEDNQVMGMKIVGIFRDEEVEDTQGFSLSKMVVGDFQDLLARAIDGSVDLIYIALPLGNQKRISSMLTALGNTTASVYIVPDFFVFNLLHSR
ncbi:hypothetical protein TI04_10590, partial [Achromatium sp. WMS2]